MSNGANKTVLAACLIRDFRFSSVGSYQAWYSKMDHSPVIFDILESRYGKDGSVLVRVASSYNNSRFLDLPQLQSDLEVSGYA